MFRVFRNLTPPASGDPARTGTDYMVALSAAAAASTFTGPVYDFRWHNHGPRIVGAHPNVVAPAIGGTPNGNGRTVYTTVAKADAATDSNLLAVLGASLGDITAAAQGMPVTAASVVAADPATYFPGTVVDAGTTYSVMTDGVIIPPYAGKDRAAGWAGIVLDCEMQDGRTPAQLQARMLAVAAMVHSYGKALIIYPDALDAPSQVNTGFSAGNARTILDAVDGLCLMVWGGTIGTMYDQFARQYAMLGTAPPPGKLFLIYELLQTALSDATLARAVALAHELAGVMVWLDGEVDSGDTAAKLAALTAMP